MMVIWFLNAPHPTLNGLQWYSCPLRLQHVYPVFVNLKNVFLKCDYVHPEAFTRTIQSQFIYIHKRHGWQRKKVNFSKGNWIFTYYNLSLEVLTLNDWIKWFLIGWSWWPSSLRHGPAATHLLGLWVWTLRGAWMSFLWVWCFEGKDICDGLITCPEKSDRVCVCHQVWSVWQ
jgi:hypothetical protein